MKLRTIIMAILIAFAVLVPGKWVARAALDLRVRYAMLEDQAVVGDPGTLSQDLADLPAPAQRVLNGSPFHKGTGSVLLRSNVACAFDTDDHTVHGRVSVVPAPFDITYVVWVRPCGSSPQTYVFKIDADGSMSADNMNAVELNTI